MASPDRIRNSQLFWLIEEIPPWALVRNTMPQDIASTTQVRMAVARVELTPSIHTLARMEVNAANKADSSANTNHMKRTPVNENIGAYI